MNWCLLRYTPLLAFPLSFFIPVQVLQLPKRLKVRCLNKRGVYLVERHRVECMCEEECARRRCGKQVFKMGAFELHAGSSSKKWKWSVCMQSGKKRLSERV